MQSQLRDKEEHWSRDDNGQLCSRQRIQRVSDDDFVANGRQDDPADDQDVPVRVDVPRTARAVRLAIEGMLAEFSRGDEVEPPKRC